MKRNCNQIIFVLILFVAIFMVGCVCKYGKSRNQVENFKVDENKIFKISEMYNEGKIETKELKVVGDSVLKGNTIINGKIIFKDEVYLNRPIISEDVIIEEKRLTKVDDENGSKIEENNILEAELVNTDNINVSEEITLNGYDLLQSLPGCLAMYGKGSDINDGASESTEGGTTGLTLGGTPYVYLEGSYPKLAGGGGGYKGINSVRALPGFIVEVYENGNLNNGNLMKTITGPYHFKLPDSDRGKVTGLKVYRNKNWNRSS